MKSQDQDKPQPSSGTNKQDIQECSRVEQFQGPGDCLVVEQIIREGTDDASQEKGQPCLFVLERYRERSRQYHHFLAP